MLAYFFIMMSVLAASLSACAGAGKDEEKTGNLPTVNPEAISPGLNPEITFIKCGKADMIILECGEETMVIDTGEEDDGEKLTRFLEERKIDRVDYLILTHFDKDHIGGASHLLKHMKVGTIYAPDYEGTNDTYYDFMNTDPKLTRLTESVRFQMGSVRVLIDPPSDYSLPDHGSEYDNDFSLITVVEYGENTLLFMGDAEEKRIKEFMGKDLIHHCDLVKMPHHGNYHPALRNLLQDLEPEYAVITDSEKNPAEKKTLKLLSDQGISVFRTAEGNVTAVSDGTTVRVSG